MDPSMIAMAQSMMSKMTPEQLAEMQRQAGNMDPSQMQQAMNMFNSMTPEQRQAAQAAAAHASPEDLIKNAGSVSSQLSAQQKYVYDASMRLKTEGNRLHGQKKFSEAAEKYSRAADNLKNHFDADSTTLSLSCRSNLASCYLQLHRWQDCVDQCNSVLQSDPTNRKAFYRRGQALSSLTMYEEARNDLQRALELSPETEKNVVQEKLDEVEQYLKHSDQGIVIEELQSDDGDAGGDSNEKSRKKEGDGSASEKTKSDAHTVAAAEPVSIEEIRPETSIPSPSPSIQHQYQLHTSPADTLTKATEVLQQDPDAIKKTAEVVASMSDSELAAQIAAAAGGGNIPGATPSMARAAAEMMKNMSPEQLQQMAQRANMFSSTNTTAAPFAAAPSPAAAADILRQDPSALKTAAKMMESMPQEQLEAMAANIPGAPPGMKIDAEQMKMAAKMMENMSADELERMTQLAQSMGVGNGGIPGTNTTRTPPLAPAAAAPAAAVASNLNSTAPTPPTFPTPFVPGAAPAFDPGNMSPAMMSQMRKQMANPEMLRSMQSMFKSMDPESLASMMRSSGLNMTPEQAQRMVDQMGNVSDKQLAWIARLTAIVNFIIDWYQKIKAWLFGNGAMSIALLILVVLVLVRIAGWI